MQNNIIFSFERVPNLLNLRCSTERTTIPGTEMGGGGVSLLTPYWGEGGGGTEDCF